ncbi:IS3 family transposase, partial [Xanthobacter flavus]
MKYAFIAEHRLLFSIRAMCRCLRVQPSGFYAWLKDPLSKRAQENQRQTELIRAAWRESGKVYGYRKLHDDLAEPVSEPGRELLSQPSCAADASCRHPGADRLQAAPGQYGGKPSLAVDNTLDRRFDAEAPDKAWVTDISYIRTHEGFAYLAVVIDLFSRRVVGWSMQARQTTSVVLQALLAAVWRRKPKGRVLVHSDQGSQFTSME